MSTAFKYIDLFSGCGGLSLGLEESGFELALAVEKSDMAAETFYHNFIKPIKNQDFWKEFSSSSTSVMEQAKHGIVVKELADVLNCDELIQQLASQEIDLVAGGPPCQGFSLAGRRNPEDIRNQLPWQFLEFVEKISPKAVIMENVAGIKQNFNKHDKEAPFEQLRLALSEMGYTVQPVLLNAMHYGVPQHRPRVMLLGIKKEIAEYLQIKTTDSTWKSDYQASDNIIEHTHPDLAPDVINTDSKVKTVKDALKTITSKAKNNVRRNHSEAIVKRFRLYQYLKENNITSKVLNIAASDELSSIDKMVEIQRYIKNAPLPAKSPDGTVIAKTSKGLMKIIEELGTKKHSQRPLSMDAPAPTMVTVPDDYIHPVEPRTLTVREMAAFQSFPNSFEFRAKETTGGTKRRVEVPQYSQVGNAVPPLMAQAVGNTIKNVLVQYSEMKLKNLA